jgi:beta-galactosidase
MVLKSAKKAVLLLMVMTMIIACFTVMPATQIPLVAQAAGEYTGDDPAEMDLGVFNFNPDWKHYKPETPQGPYITACSGVKQGDLNFWDAEYNDSAWVDVTLPHTINDVDAFHSRADPNGDLGTYVGVVFYRKHFRLPSAYEGKKVFIEFEGVRQAAYVYLNGEMVGFYQAGVSAFGFDLSAHNLNFGDDENVIAVGIDCSGTWGGSSANVPLPANRPAGAWYNLTETRPGSEPGTNDGQRYVWNYHNFNTMQGGINKNVYLHVKDKIFQTLPLYANLQTQGTYVYPTDIDVANRSATINVEAEVRNEDAAKAVTMEVVLVDKKGDVVGSFESAPVNVPLATDISQNKTAHYTNVIVPNAYTVVSNVAPLPPIAQPGLTNPDDWGWRSVTKITASGIVKNLNLWSLDDPYLYDVYTILKDSSGNRLDVRKITTGFRKIVFKGNTPGNMGGIEINDEFVWLTGYAQRSTCEWASLGIAPDWLNDYDMGLVKESNANHVRWMHIAPPPSLVRASDKYGILVTVPCGDAEQDETGRSWVQRVELMRNVIIYFRNNPSVFTWEIGNNSVSNQHLTDMKITKDRLDPIAKGNRAIGCRQISASAASSTGMEYASYMEATASTTNGRDISPNMPFLEAEYMRDEAPRRVWDRYSPPDYDFKHIYSGSEQSSSTSSNPMRDGWDHTSEDLVVRGVSKYNIYWPNRVRGGSATPHFSGIAVLCWSDSDQHGRMPESQNARMSGRVDAVRVKKPSFYGFQAMQATEPALYLVGHWTYPDATEPGAYRYLTHTTSAYGTTYADRYFVLKFK